MQAGALFLQNRRFRFKSKNRSKKHPKSTSKIKENLKKIVTKQCKIKEKKAPQQKQGPQQQPKLRPKQKPKQKATQKPKQKSKQRPSQKNQQKSLTKKRRKKAQ